MSLSLSLSIHQQNGGLPTPPGPFGCHPCLRISEVDSGQHPGQSGPPECRRTDMAGRSSRAQRGRGHLAFVGRCQFEHPAYGGSVPERSSVGSSEGGRANGTRILQELRLDVTQIEGRRHLMGVDIADSELYRKHADDLTRFATGSS